MSNHFRKFNDNGIAAFASWLKDGGQGSPTYLLSDQSMSQPLEFPINPVTYKFRDRYEFGCYLCKLLEPFRPNDISHDRGLWTALAAFWIDQICPADSSGRRKVKRLYRYILSTDYRHYYRHLVRSPWQLVKDHGVSAKFLLLERNDSDFPLQRHGDILEQLGSRQGVLRSRTIVAEASRLYSEPDTGRPKRGVAGSGAGSVRRLALVLQQLDLTYDPDEMKENALLSVLPREFDRWKV